MRGQERQEETVERLEPLGAGSGAADIEYEQFMKAKEVQRAMFQGREQDHCAPMCRHRHHRSR